MTTNMRIVVTTPAPIQAPISIWFLVLVLLVDEELSIDFSSDLKSSFRKLLVFTVLFS